MTTVLEGTWEEIKAHDIELAGRNVRLIVEPKFDLSTNSVQPNTVHTVEHLEELLQEGIDSGPMTPMTAADWDDIRREGRALAAQGRASMQANA